MSRVGKFIGRIFFITLFIAIIGAGVYVAQLLFHPFDNIIAYINQDVNKVNNTLSVQFFAGISISTIVLVLLVFIFPIFHKGVDNKKYFIAVQRGVVSSFVYFITDMLYRYMENISRFYLLLSIAGVLAATYILVEVLSLSIKKEEEVEFRTDIVAAVVAGLIFGILIKMAQFGLDFVKHGAK